MRPHLVRLNSTITSQAPLLFSSFLTAEAKAIHRNFRVQVCLASIVYDLGIFARFVLIYYHIYDIPLKDDDPTLLLADLLRDTVIGYYCGLAVAFIIQTLVATDHWKWYESHSCSTIYVILVTETVNLSISFSNAYIWLMGYTPFIINIGYLAIMLSCSVSIFFYTYTKNARQLKSLTKSRISHATYTVDRSFQIRENVVLMKFMNRVSVPSTIIASPCFICFAFNAYGPEDWLLARSIAFSLWDLFFAIFRIIYLQREITKHPLIYREFVNLSVIRIFHKQKIRVDEVSNVVTIIDVSPTQSYFDQFKSAWK